MTHWLMTAPSVVDDERISSIPKYVNGVLETWNAYQQLKLTFRLGCHPIEIKFQIGLWHNWNLILDWVVTQLKLKPRLGCDPIKIKF